MIARAEFGIEEIKMNLVESCINFNAFGFLPYLLSPLVRVCYPNKIRFYSYLQDILKSAEENSIGQLELRIEKGHWEEDKDLWAYNFYDQQHKYPRINLQVKENGNNIFLDIMPF